MPTPFDQLLKDLQAAQGDPAALALVTFDFAVAKDPLLKQAATAAAIPHWFDGKALAALLPEHAAQADCLMEQLKELPMVERYERGTGDPAWNVHEATRLALRDRLWQFDPERFKALSRRAAAAYGRADDTARDFVLTCEHLYHQLAGQTQAGDAAMAEVTGKWRVGFHTEPLQTLARLLEELLAARPAPPLLPRGEGLSHQAIADARENHQPASVTVASAMKAEIIFRALVAANPTHAEMQHDLCVSLDRLGDLAVAQGDLPGASNYFTENKAIAESLAANDPDNFSLQRDFSVSQLKLGDLAVSQGNQSVAFRHFSEANTVFERLALSAPADACLQRDVYVSQVKLGDLALAQGDLSGALRNYAESKTIAENLATSDPANASWQYDLGISNERLGELAVNQGKLDEALFYHTKRKDIISDLCGSDPTNAAWQRDLSVSLEKLGSLSVKQGDLAGAMHCFTESKIIAERLATSDPSNTVWQSDLSVSLNKLGDLAVKQGDLAGALRSYTESKTIRERLAASDPANAEWQRNLWVSYWRLAAHCEKSGEIEEAKAWWKKAFDTLNCMKARGLHVSPEDMGFFELLQAKVGI